MEPCFASCLQFTKTEEGGYTHDRRDSGNWTSGHVGQGTLVGSNMGVGAPVLAAWMASSGPVTAELMRGLPATTYEAIARSNYWAPLGCGVLPAGIDLMLFDFGWNRGVATSRDLLARCLDVAQPERPALVGDVLVELLQKTSWAPRLGLLLGSDVRILQRALGVRDDGIAGAETSRMLTMRPDLRVMAIILLFSTAQIASYRKLANFSIYGAGWLARSGRRRIAALAVAGKTASITV